MLGYLLEGRNYMLNHFILQCFKVSLCFCLLLLLNCSLAIKPALSQQIIPDGNTNTTLNIKENTTDITTSTIRGTNAFNSFARFNVNTGNTVNLILPSNTNNLINLVNSEQSQINGILNSIKDGHIGGNVFIANPYGIVVGSQGIINTGSLTAITPTNEFMNSFFNSPGNPSEASVEALLNGTAPINNNTPININGKINAINSVNLDSGEINHSGEIKTGHAAIEAIKLVEDIVNTGNFLDSDSLVLQKEQISLKSFNNTNINGSIIADGINNQDALSISIEAKSDIILNREAFISAKGTGENSSGGNVYIYAQNNTYFNEGAVIDVSGGNISGDGGFIELSAKNTVELNGGIFKAKSYDGTAGNILIDPTDININGDVSGNQYSDGGNITVTAANSITADNVIVSSRNIADPDFGNHETDPSEGDSGNITFEAPQIYIQNGTKLLSFADNGFTGGNITINADASALTGSTVTARVDISNSTINCHDLFIQTTGGIATNAAGSAISASKIKFTGTTVNANDIDLIAIGENAIVSNAGVGIANPQTSVAIYSSIFNADHNINFYAEGGDASTVNTTSIPETAIAIHTNSQLIAGNDIILHSIAGDASISSNPLGGTVYTDTYIENSSQLTAGGDIKLQSDGGNHDSDCNVFVRDSATLTADGKIELISNSISETSDIQVITGASLTALGNINLLSTAGNLLTSSSTKYADSKILIDNATLSSDQNIIMTLQGGEISLTAAGNAEINTECRINDSTLDASLDIIIEAYGGIATSSSDQAFSQSSIIFSNANLEAIRDITLETQGGNAIATLDIDQTGSGIVAMDSYLNAGRNINFIAENNNVVPDADSRIYTDVGATNSSHFHARGGVYFSVTGNSQDNSCSAYIDDSVINASREVNFSAVNLSANSEAYMTNGASITLGALDDSITVDSEGRLDLLHSTLSIDSGSDQVFVSLSPDINITFSADNIYGDGGISFFEGYTSLIVENNSTKDVVLDDINLYSTGHFIKNGTYTGTITVLNNIDSTSRSITVNNNGLSNVIVTGDVQNQDGQININSVLDVILDSGSQITSNYSSDAIVTNITNGNFINNEGASALSTPSGRWLVYTGNPDDTLEGGLIYSKLYNATYASTPPAAVPAGNYMLYSIAPVLTFTADDYTRDYGDPNPLLTYTVSGYLDGDTAVNSFTGDPALSTLVDSSTSPGIYDITITSNTLTALMGYQLDFADGHLTIDPATLTITAENKSKDYGSDNPSFTSTYSGFKLSDTPADLTGDLVYNTIADNSSPVGNYNITPSGYTSSNYTINYVDGLLSVTPVNLTIQADNQSKTYGVDLPGFTATYTGFVNGDSPEDLTNTLIFSTPATKFSNVSNYNITPSGQMSTNYNITYVDGSLSVLPANLIISADNKVKIYGDPNPPFTATGDGFVLGETFSDLAGSLQLITTATDSSPVGNYPIIVFGVSSPNYNITFEEGTLSIGYAILQVMANNVVKIYGEQNPLFTASYNGFVSGDDPGDLQGDLIFSTSANNFSPVGNYNVTPSGYSSNYYAIEYIDGQLTIDPAALNITVDNANKAYGQANPEFTASYNGFVNSDSPDNLTGTLAFSTVATEASPIGNYNVTASGLISANYNISYTGGLLTVNPADLLVIADNKTKTYGSNNPDLTATLNGLVLGETINELNGTLLLTTTAETSSSVGTYPINASGLSSSNYNITYQEGTLTVNQANLNITVNNTSKTYGHVNPEFTVLYEGFVNADTSDVLNGGLDIETPATESSSVGNYAVTASGLTSLNYDINYFDGVLTIDPALLTVEADDFVKTYGEQNPEFTAAISGYVLNETIDNLTGELVLNTTATQASPVGNYAIKPSGLSSNNYVIDFVNGDLLVIPKELIIKANDATKIFGENNPPFTASYEGFIEGDAASSLNGILYFLTSADTSSQIGTYPIYPFGLSSNNYFITYNPGSLQILPLVQLIDTEVNKDLNTPINNLDNVFYDLENLPLLLNSNNQNDLNTISSSQIAEFMSIYSAQLEKSVNSIDQHFAQNSFKLPQPSSPYDINIDNPNLVDNNWLQNEKNFINSQFKGTYGSRTVLSELRQEYLQLLKKYEDKLEYDLNRRIKEGNKNGWTGNLNLVDINRTITRDNYIVGSLNQIISYLESKGSGKAVNINVAEISESESSININDIINTKASIEEALSKNTTKLQNIEEDIDEAKEIVNLEGEALFKFVFKKALEKTIDTAKEKAGKKIFEEISSFSGPIFDVTDYGANIAILFQQKTSGQITQSQFEYEVIKQGVKTATGLIKLDTPVDLLFTYYESKKEYRDKIGFYSVKLQLLEAEKTRLLQENSTLENQLNELNKVMDQLIP